ncbi:hypothetical protein ACFS07_06110 [Undibacterium arcticum]
MNQQHAAAVNLSPWIVTSAPRARVPQQPVMAEERLPFTVRLVRNEDDLCKAVHIRHSAYARHVPTFAETLKSPETSDAENGVVVLLAESKLDGSPPRHHAHSDQPLQTAQRRAISRSAKLAQGTIAGRSDSPGGY